MKKRLFSLSMNMHDDDDTVDDDHDDHELDAEGGV